MIITIPGLKPGKDYSVQVRVKTDESASEWSPSFTFTTDATGPLPATPTTPTWVVSGDAFYGEWDRVDTDVNGTDAVITRYELELSVGASVRYVSIPQSTASRIGYTVTFADNLALFTTPQASIGMRVRAVNTIGTTSAWTTLITATNPAPAALSAINVSAMINAVNVSWPASTENDVSSYVLQYATASTGPWTTIYSGAGNSYTHSNTLWNSDSFYRVAAVDKFNTSSTYVTSGAVRPQSAFGADTTPPNNPTGVTVTPGFDATKQNAYISVSWTASTSTDVGSYAVRYSLDGTNWQTVNVDADVTGVRLNNLIAGTAYYVAVRAKDTSGNVATSWVNANTYPVTTTNDTAAPSTPQAPTAAVGTDRIQVTVSGLNSAAGAMEPDVDHYQVHASSTSGFTASNATQLGTIRQGPAMVGTFMIPASAASGTTQTWYVLVRAVDRAGNVSPSSAQTTASVNLIQTANIGDAQITNAKINDLAANKITAGTGIINDLTVKSKLTLGDASTVGTIESYDYTSTAGASGFTMSKNGLIIKSGQIEAAALKIQSASNLMPASLASFELSTLTGYVNAAGATAALGFTIPRQGTRYATFSWSSGGTPNIYLGATATDYNIVLDPGKSYIVSVYLRTSASTPVSLFLVGATSSATVFSGVAPTSTWSRFSGVVTATDTANILRLFSSATTGSFDVDCIQVEERIGSINTPSTWSPGGNTTISGGQITTGAIQSTALAIDASGATIANTPAWKIDVAGNASFGNALIRGSMIVGNGTDPAPNPDNSSSSNVNLNIVKSYNYVSGVSGWAIKGDGTAEFRQLQSDSIDGEVISADSITARQIASGSIIADSLAAEIVMSSALKVGGQDIGGLDPTTLEANLLPLLTTGVGSATLYQQDIWSLAQAGTTAIWSWSIADYIPPNDDPIRARFSDASYAAMKAVDTNTVAGRKDTFVASTKITVEPNTEYRFTVGAAYPGVNRSMANPVGTNDHTLNQITVYFAANNTPGVGQVVEEFSFAMSQCNGRPDFVQFDDAIIRTGNGQTSLYVLVQMTADYVTSGGGEGVYLFQPVLRKNTARSNSVLPPAATAPSNLGVVIQPSPTNTVWQASAMVFGGGTPTVTTQTYTPQASTFGPPPYGVPGRYSYLTSTTAPFQSTYGASITYSNTSAGTSTTEYMVSPTVTIPDLSDIRSRLYLEYGIKGPSNTSATDLVEIYAHWFDSTNTLISNPAVLSKTTAQLGVNSATENYWVLQLTPPAGAVSVGFQFKFTANTIPANTNRVLGVHGTRLYSLIDVNNNYGGMVGSHVDIDTEGVRLLNGDGQIQVNIPTDPDTGAFFKGDLEADSLRILGGASFESTSEIAKDSSLSLSAGIKSPVGVPQIVQEYEQYNAGRQVTSLSRATGFSTMPTLNPSQITSMAWYPEWNAFMVTENRGGGIAVWQMKQDGSADWVYFEAGFSNAAMFRSPSAPAGIGLEFVAEYAGNTWAYVYNGTGVVTNMVPSGQIPQNSNKQAFMHPTNGLLYIFYISGGVMHYRRYTPSPSNGATMTLLDHIVMGAGTASGTRSAGVVLNGARLVAAYNTNTAIKSMTGGTGGVAQAGEGWDVASVPQAFCYDGTYYWQIDSAGKFTKYSNWTWSETNHRLYAGITWADTDSGGTGVHETDLTTTTSVALKKRISNMRLTLPSVPDKGGADDPNQWNLYVYKGPGLSLPANRTNLFLQTSGGSPTAQTSYSIPAGGIVTTGSNPPATNNFPGAGSATITSAATDASSNPLIKLSGDGTFTLGKYNSTTFAGATIAMGNPSTISVLWPGGSGAFVKNGGGLSVLTQTTAYLNTAIGLGYSAGEYTCLVPGVFKFDWITGMPNMSGQRPIIGTTKNNTVTTGSNLVNRIEVQPPGSSAFLMSLSTTIELAAGDVMRFYWYNGTGVDMTLPNTLFNLNGTALSQLFTVTRLSP